MFKGEQSNNTIELTRYVAVASRKQAMGMRVNQLLCFNEYDTMTMDYGMYDTMKYSVNESTRYSVNEIL